MLLLALLLAVLAEPAHAHGPCGCLQPASGRAGTTVTIASPAYKVVFNPDRTDLGIGPRSLWRDHRPELAPQVVYRRTYRYAELPLQGPVSVRVPDAPPGRYLIGVYDGGEGGAHYTWEYFTVTGRRPVAPRPEPAGRRVPVLAAVLIGLAGVVAGRLSKRRL